MNSQEATFDNINKSNYLIIEYSSNREAHAKVLEIDKNSGYIICSVIESDINSLVRIRIEIRTEIVKELYDSGEIVEEQLVDYHYPHNYFDSFNENKTINIKDNGIGLNYDDLKDENFLLTHEKEYMNTDPDEGKELFEDEEYDRFKI